MTDDDGRPMFSIGQLEDITERKAFSDRLQYEAAHDAMTGLLNRASFAERVEAVLEAEAAVGRKAAVLFIDLDHFKLINDSLGHAAGDDLLITVAQRLRHALRPGDLLARFGGDEFVLLCGNLVGQSAVTTIAQRMIAAIAEPIVVGTDEVFVTASIGIAIASVGDTAETLLRHADAAMYHAKNDGRARATVFRPDHHGWAVAALKTGNDLHRALDRDELVLHYQPIIDLRTGRVVGFEALMRWNHPERGLLNPSDFIAFAEETGLIVPMGTWALETACRQTAYWQSVRDRTTSEPPLTISVNLAARQVGDRTLAKTVAEIIDRTGISADAVCLELTENTLMQDTASTVDALHALRSQGVHLSIDDFGTGYSSLSYLKRFPVEALKIDRSFIDGLGCESEDTSIVEAIIRLAHALELSAVAEGLETPTQLETLRTLGCDFAQGYLIGHPLPAEVIGDMPADDLTTWQDQSHDLAVPGPRTSSNRTRPSLGTPEPPRGDAWFEHMAPRPPRPVDEARRDLSTPNGRGDPCLQFEAPSQPRALPGVAGASSCASPRSRRSRSGSRSCCPRRSAAPRKRPSASVVPPLSACWARRASRTPAPPRSTAMSARSRHRPRPASAR